MPPPIVNPNDLTKWIAAGQLVITTIRGIIETIRVRNPSSDVTEEQVFAELMATGQSAEANANALIERLTQGLPRNPDGTIIWTD